MPSITAFQHFYSRVPREQSPRGLAGFQTLFHTRGLSAEVIRGVESCAQYTTSPGEPIKKQFYPLPGGMVAISQTVPLQEPDEFGRRGRYLVHTLVLDRDNFSKLGACPLDVLEKFRFVRTIAEVYEQCGRSAAEAPAVTLTIEPEWEMKALQAVRKWKPQSLVLLGRLVWQAKQLIQKAEPVILIGSVAEQFETLGILFLLASPPQQRLLSFDTHAAGCDWGWRVMFWVQGYVETDPSVRAAHLVDAHGRSVSTQLSPSDDGLFGKWMVSQGLPEGWDQWEQRRAWAAVLAEFLTDVRPAVSGKNAEMLGSIPRHFVERFARLDPEAVASRWAAHLPPGLPAELTWDPEEPILARPGGYLRQMVKGLQSYQIDEFMFDRLLRLGAPPRKPERRRLEKWIPTREHAGLKTLLPLWGKDSKAWSRSLMDTTEEQYELIIIRIMRWPKLPFSLLNALVEPHASIWIRVCARLVPPEAWKKTLNILAGFGDSFLDKLVDVIFHLPPESREEITIWLKRSRVEAPGLRKRLRVPLRKRRLKLR